MKNLTVNITGKCNASCKHCCFSCSPQKTDELSEEEIWSVVDYGIDNDEIEEIAISGGEPFLREDLVFEIIKKVAGRGKSVTCVTNGFWADTYEESCKKMMKLAKLGLKAMSISCDDFHAEFIPTNNIKNILSASVQLPIRIFLNMAVTKEKDGTQLLAKLGNHALGIPITRYSVAPAGRAFFLDFNQFYYKLDINNPMKCSEPSSGLVFHHDGYVYPCCSPLVFDTVLRIGNFRKNTIDKLEEKFYSNILLYVIKKEGFDWFIARCQEKNQNTFREKYISSCELCRDLFKDESVINLVYDDLKRYYEDELL